MRKTGMWIAAVMLAGVDGLAAPAVRVQVHQRGDLVLLGNGLGQDCMAGTPPPVVGTVGACGSSTTDSAMDIYWRADSPAAGQAAANTAITPADARSTAVLSLPSGAVVTHAFLYWGATQDGAGVDNQVVLDRPGASGFSANVTALQSYTSVNNSYQSVADVTELVQANGPGAYRVSGVALPTLLNVDNSNAFGGWWMAVFYGLASDPLRNLVLLDGLDAVAPNTPQNVLLSGFQVPMVVGMSKLGVVAFEGDNALTGDQLFFNGGAALTNALNPANNFFNGTHSMLGAAVSNPGDLPQLTGTPQSLSGLDLDVVDVTSKLVPGQTSAMVSATSAQDIYYLAGFVVSIPTIKPDFSSSTKSVVDVNGGAVLPGDVLQYTVTVVNTGNDTAILTTMTDPLPTGVTYVPGSTRITTGANPGSKTDGPGDDQAEYTAATRILTVRLGINANAASGGDLAEGASTTVVFQVRVDETFLGTLDNQAVISSAGKLGSPAEDTPTDGNGPAAGAPPASIVVDRCDSDQGCSAPTPYCETRGSPKHCVACILDAQCLSNEVCNLTTHVCDCVPTGPELCDGQDNDCNGTIDDGFNVGEACTVGVGACMNSGVLVCADLAGARCDAQAGSPEPEKCDLLDNDCDGQVDNGNPGGDVACTTPLPGLCAEGRTACSVAGELDCVPTVNPGTVAEECNNLDDDCDGEVDNGNPGGGVECATGLAGLCAPGVTSCASPGLLECAHLVEPGQVAEQCNGMDEDCDGAADNGFNLGASCTAGVGACATPGIRVCDGAGRTACNAVPGAPTPEVCGNAVDEDCDGTLDNGCADSDGDGLFDAVELAAGTDPNDADSDDDGVVDGQEPMWNQDTDGDQRINALDPDSDDDGLMDGTELGLPCSNPATDLAANHCTPDADQGATTTDPLVADSDHAGKLDGEEDGNGNGQVDPGERDPNNAADDALECMVDAECGPPASGRVCEANGCVEGCRGTGGNGCPPEQHCTSRDGTAGQCEVSSSSSSGSSGSSSSSSAGSSSSQETASSAAEPSSASAGSSSSSLSAVSQGSSQASGSVGSSSSGVTPVDGDGGGSDSAGCACTASAAGEPLARWGLLMALGMVHWRRYR